MENEVTYPRPVRLSPTKLQAWYEAGCPAKFQYEQEWEPAEGNKFLEVGSEVHRLMENNGTGEVEWEETDKFVSKLEDLLAALDVEIEQTETKIEWEIEPGITWVVKFDAFARFRKNGELVVLDYKTNWGKGWKDIAPLIVPAALAFQSPAYLMQPPLNVWGGEWPSRMIYLVAPLWSPGQYHIVSRNEESERNLHAAIVVAASAIRTAEEQGTYPKVRGKLCLDCKVKSICYDLSGWESEFKEKRHG